MKLFNKKAYITDFGDFFKGIVLGFIIGAVLIYLAAKGYIGIPLP